MKRDLQADDPDARPSERLADGVYQTMLNQLISQEIEPGARITVDGVSRDLKVSQTPVREALTRLESDGLVAKTHLVGYRATDRLTRGQFENLFDLRLLLEPETAARAAKNLSAEQRDAMLVSASLMTRLDSKIDRPTYGDFAVEDGKLHDLIALTAGNEFIRECLSRAHPHLHLFRLHYNTKVSYEALAEHQVLIDAIVAADPAAARAAMRRHLQRSRGRLRSAFE
jgi:DNA-binding GntR family transcriptional regulator